MPVFFSTDLFDMWLQVSKKPENDIIYKLKIKPRRMQQLPTQTDREDDSSHACIFNENENMVISVRRRSRTIPSLLAFLVSFRIV